VLAPLSSSPCRSGSYVPCVLGPRAGSSVALILTTRALACRSGSGALIPTIGSRSATTASHSVTPWWHSTRHVPTKLATLYQVKTAHVSTVRQDKMSMNHWGRWWPCRSCRKPTTLDCTYIVAPCHTLLQDRIETDLLCRDILYTMCNPLSLV
jgi:hypothetical protein